MRGSYFKEKSREEKVKIWLKNSKIGNLRSKERESRNAPKGNRGEAWKEKVASRPGHQMKLGCRDS